MKKKTHWYDHNKKNHKDILKTDNIIDVIFKPKLKILSFNSDITIIWDIVKLPYYF